MSKFKVGDKVAAYHNSHRYIGHIKAIDPDGSIDVEGVDVWVHPKQCRKLVKKERRRIWILKTQYGIKALDRINTTTVKPDRDIEDWIEFVEVKKK